MAHVFVLDKVQTIIPSPRHVILSDTVIPDVFNRESTGPETWRWLLWLPPLDQVWGPD